MPVVGRRQTAGAGRGSRPGVLDVEFLLKEKEVPKISERFSVVE